MQLRSVGEKRVNRQKSFGCPRVITDRVAGMCRVVGGSIENEWPMASAAAVGWPDTKWHDSMNWGI
jgi:hypothetical protein